MTLWNVEHVSVTNALITLNIPSTNQIAGKWKWHQRGREMILTGNSQYSLGNSLFIWELWKKLFYLLNIITEFTKISHITEGMTSFDQKRMDAKRPLLDMIWLFRSRLVRWRTTPQLFFHINIMLSTKKENSVGWRKNCPRYLQK